MGCAGATADEFEGGPRPVELSPMTMAFQIHSRRGRSPVSGAKPIPSEVAFATALDRIDQSDRNPTPWEAGCLYAALCAMVVGDHQAAERHVALCALGDTGLPPPVRLLPPLTADELRDALATLEKPDEQVPARGLQRGRFATPILAIIALLVSFVLLHPWLGYSSGPGRVGKGAQLSGLSSVYSIHGPVSAKPPSRLPTSLTQ